MRKLYFLLLLLITSSGFAFSPPVLNEPIDISLCSGSAFDLTIQYPQILGVGQDPALYSASYYLSQSDADAGINAILTPTSFFVDVTQQIFIRVQEIANPSQYAVVDFVFIVQPAPEAIMSFTLLTLCEGDSNAAVIFEGFNGSSPFTFHYTIDGGAVQTVMTTGVNFASVLLPPLLAGSHVVALVAVESIGCFNPQNQSQIINVLPAITNVEPIDITIEQIPYVGTAVFDLTFNTPLLMNGDPNVEVTYHIDYTGAATGSNPIVNPATFTATNGTTIYARIFNNLGSCTAIKDFGLYITNPDIVFIPDANFKQALVTADGFNQAAQDLAHNFTILDANGDGQVQYSEAANISFLNIPQSGIADLTGLEAFPNVGWLNVGYNAQLTAIPTTALPLLYDLSATHCNIAALDFSNNPLLTSVGLEYNNLSSLDFSASPLMSNITCQNNHLTTLDLTGLTNLLYLTASDNEITSLNTEDLQSIISFNVAANNLTSLSTVGMGTVQTLICQNNTIDSLSTAGCANLQNLRCAANEMTYLEVGDSVALSNLDCSQNSLLNLDVSSNTALCGLNCSWNITLNSINIKNGVDSCYPNFNFLGPTNVLQQFCCDDNEVAYFKNYFQTNMSANINVSSYCSFTPGGDYNTINANVTFDVDNNGCNINDDGFPNVRLNINDGTNSGATFTDVNGLGYFYTQAGSFTITPSVENPTWYTISPASLTIPFANTSNNTANQNFCIAANGAHRDLEVVIAPLTTARPGFNASYKIVYRNKGNFMISQVNGVELMYDTAKLDFLFADDSPLNPTPGELYWTIGDLAPFESRSITLTMYVHAPTETSPANIGDILQFTTQVFPIATDENPGDNIFQFNHTVVGSYDPNEIVCLEGNIVSPVEIGNYLHYIINFENTGNADAENIVVRELIDTTQFDVSTLQLLNSSAAVTTRLTGNLAEFIFPSINLHSGGHGNILLKIRSNNTLTEGDIVSKRANIYFDYNFPVETPPEDTVFQSLSNPDVAIDASVSIYPNPTKGLITIECNNTIKSVQLYDVQGRILQTNVVNESQASLDMSSQSKGIYFIKIISDNGMKVQKIVKD
jgi:hypothetical protein